MRWCADLLVIGADIYKIPDGLSGFVDTKPAALFGGVSGLAAISYLFHQNKTARYKGLAKGCSAGCGKCHYAEFVRLRFLLYWACLYGSADEIVYHLDNEFFVNILPRRKNIGQKQTFLVRVGAFGDGSDWRALL